MKRTYLARKLYERHAPAVMHIAEMRDTSTSVSDGRGSTGEALRWDGRAWWRELW